MSHHVAASLKAVWNLNSDERKLLGICRDGRLPSCSSRGTLRRTWQAVVKPAAAAWFRRAVLVERTPTASHLTYAANAWPVRQCRELSPHQSSTVRACQVATGITGQLPFQQSWNPFTNLASHENSWAQQAQFLPKFLFCFEEYMLTRLLLGEDAGEEISTSSSGWPAPWLWTRHSWLHRFRALRGWRPCLAPVCITFHRTSKTHFESSTCCFAAVSGKGGKQCRARRPELWAEGNTTLHSCCTRVPSQNSSRRHLWQCVHTLHPTAISGEVVGRLFGLLCGKNMET